jgi:hypothetical protein
MRDDQTAFCVQCGARQPAGERCVRCGRGLRDLVDPEERREALAEWGTRYHATESEGRFRRMRVALLLAFVAGIGAVGLTIAASMEMLPADMSITAISFLASGAGVALLVLLSKLLSRSSQGAFATVKTSPGGPPLAVPLFLVPAPLPPDAADTVQGRVVAVTTEQCPFGDEPCVAWRVTGRGPGGPIDEGRTLPFDVKKPSGELVRVDVSGGSCAMLARSDARFVTLTPAQGAYLEARGAQPALGRVALRASVLRPGDPVIVTGVLEERATADGFRGARTSRWITGAPVVVRDAIANEIGSEARAEQAPREGEPVHRAE